MRRLLEDLAGKLAATSSSLGERAAADAEAVEACGENLVCDVDDKETGKPLKRMTCGGQATGTTLY